MSIDYEGYGFRIRANSQEEAMTNVNNGYIRLVRFFNELEQFNDSKIKKLLEKYQIEVFR